MRALEFGPLDELRKKYPEAFKRPYHPATGLVMERVLEGGKKTGHGLPQK